MTNVINTTGIEFTDAAWENLEECAVNVDQDLATARRKGPQFKGDFLAHCLDGADADREQGWRDYADALFDAAEGTTVETLSRKQITALRDESASAGDILTSAICERALGNDVPESFALDADERARAEQMSVEAARTECVRVIRDAEAQQ